MPVYFAILILDISMNQCMNFGLIILTHSITTKQNYAIYILVALLLILKPKIFTKNIADDVEKQVSKKKQKQRPTKGNTQLI